MKKLYFLNFGWILFILFYITFGSLFILYGKFDFNFYAKLFYVFNFISFILCIFNYIFNGFRKVDIAILLLMIFGGIATIFSDYSSISLWGQPGRYEGLIMLCSYYILYVLSSFVCYEDKLKIIKFMLYLGVFQVLIGILQQFDLVPIVFDGTHYSGGLVGNSNYFSTQNILWLALALGLFIFSKKWSYLIFVFIFSVGLFLGGAMSCFVGLICVLFGILFIIFYNRHNFDVRSIIKKFLISILVCVVSFVIVSLATNNGIGKDIGELFSQSKDIAFNQKTDDTYGTYRLYIWKNTIPKIDDYLFLGVGIDCFRYIFNPMLTLPNGIVGKAHNEYLQILITEGVFALTAYLALLFLNLVNNFKRIKTSKFDFINYAILFAVIGYITQAFFNISVIRVAPLFYILLGLSYDRGFRKEN